MGNTLGFIIFSAIEGLGIYYLMLAAFRLNPIKHLQYFVPVLAVMVLVSFVLREELSFPYVVPVASILLFVILLTVFLKIPIVWSFIITLVGYTAFGVLQWGLLVLILGNTSVLEESTLNGYILQSVTALIQFMIAYFLLKFRIGFTADFDLLKFRFEQYIIITMIVLTMVGLALVALNVNSMFIVMACFIYFLYFAINKEVEA